jgi:pimeloyl-ACP methyl ester carboxylesterase
MTCRINFWTRKRGGRCNASRETKRSARCLIYFNEVDKGGHFAAWEQPELFIAELRAGFRSA